VDYRARLYSALKRKDAGELLGALKEASDAEEDLAELIRPVQKDAASILFEGLKDERTHDASALVLAKICARDRKMLLEVCRLLEDENPALIAGAAAVLANTCSRSPKACADLPEWVIERLATVLKRKPEREPFVDRRRWSRVRAIDALGTIGNPAAIPHLVAALDDKDVMIVMRARYALARISDPVKVVDEISRHLSTEARVVPLVNALWVLERITLASSESQMAGFKKVVPILSRLIVESKDPEVRLRAMRALVNIDKNQGVGAISKLLYMNFGAKDERVWRAAIRSLERMAKIGCPEALHALRAFVEREEKFPEGRRSAAYSKAKSVLGMLEAEEKT